MDRYPAILATLFGRHLPLLRPPRCPRLSPRGHAAGLLDCDRGDRAGAAGRLAVFLHHILNRLLAISVPSTVVAEPLAVGRITGMVDCKWEKKGLGIRDWGLEKGSGFRVQGSGTENHRSPIFQSLIPNPQSLVSLGDKFTLASGLMEITYHTGAKVILQGPVTYSVEANGGYLSVGKLTGKLEKKAEGGRRKAERRSHTESSIRNPPSPFPLPPLSCGLPPPP